MNQILTLNIDCVRGPHLTEAYGFVLQVRGDMPLHNLGTHILNTVRFDDDHLDGFYVATNPYGKKTWLTRQGPWDDISPGGNAATLGTLFPLPKNKKLFYLFDFG